MLEWRPSDIPDGLVLMLIKSVSNLQQLDQIISLVKKAQPGAPVVLAYIELLQQFKKHEIISTEVESLYEKMPNDKLV